ncbi:MAG: hypothetical protein Q4D33_09855 [Prevotellaceae bacterium]|nr:hypothetical protein [Prevotellaceae bacterium]
MEQNVQTHELVAVLAKQLPLSIRRGFNVDIIVSAIEENIIALGDDGHLVWLPQNNTLLAYFCGRMWCGDKPVYIRSKGCQCWKTGKGIFHDIAFEQLFGVKDLRKTRWRRIGRRTPENADIIDELF